MAPTARAAASLLLSASAATATTLRQAPLRDQDGDPNFPGFMDPNCPCIAWPDVFGDQAPHCGHGWEIRMGQSKDNKTTTGFQQEYCTKVWEKLKTGLCTNVAYGADVTSQWCYTKAACSVLNNGAKTASVAWKICKPDYDELTNTKSVREIEEIADQYDVDLETLVQMTYPFARGLQWHRVQNFFYTGKLHNEKDGSMLGKLQKLQDSGMPHVISNTSKLELPLFVAEHKKVYKIVPNFRNDMNLRRDHDGKRHTFKCVVGCA